MTVFDIYFCEGFVHIDFTDTHFRSFHGIVDQTHDAAWVNILTVT
jgi:hypothetical protein